MTLLRQELPDEFIDGMAGKLVQIAAMCHQSAKVRYLIVHCPGLNPTSIDWNKALNDLCDFSGTNDPPEVNVVDMLDSKANDNTTAFYSAIEWRYNNVVAYFLSRHNHYDMNKGLLLAAQRFNVELIDVFIHRGATNFVEALKKIVSKVFSTSIPEASACIKLLLPHIHTIPLDIIETAKKFPPILELLVS
jgi:hypothetical protein